MEGEEKGLLTRKDRVALVSIEVPAFYSNCIHTTAVSYYYSACQLLHDTPSIANIQP